MRRPESLSGASSRPPLAIGPLPIGLLENPLVYIHADHARQRAVCGALMEFARQGQASRADADMVTAFLIRDLPLHYADEDADLYPLVRQRSLTEDNLGAVLARLSDDHRLSRSTAVEIAEALCEHPIRNSVSVDGSLRTLVQAFAVHERHHLALENSVVLTIAAIRLTKKDLREMSRRMKVRRGVKH